MYGYTLHLSPRPRGNLVPLRGLAPSTRLYSWQYLPSHIYPYVKVLAGIYLHVYLLVSTSTSGCAGTRLDVGQVSGGSRHVDASKFSFGKDLEEGSERKYFETLWRTH